ncbi:unnamed protein product [Mesocestoides corti]|uniref:G protein-coupled receptor n=1 Tax=Mesocestoides corti TaxID=53468 RepID=A0A0R3ULI7_MESCO|nr:unnamed protein product [Mesocestoides corti]
MNEVLLNTYHYSCQAVVVFALPLGVCAVMAICLTNWMVTLEQSPKYPYVFELAQSVAGLLVVVGELIVSRLVLLAPPITRFNRDLVEAEAGGRAIFDPLHHIKSHDCKLLAFTQYFVTAFRGNLYLFIVCFQMGSNRLRSQDVAHLLNISTGLLAAFITALMTSLPVVLLTHRWRVWNITVCDFHPQKPQILFLWLNYHRVLLCDSLIAFSLVFLLEKVESARNRSLKKTLTYLQFTHPRHSFMSLLLENVARKIKLSLHKLSPASYYCCHVAAFRATVALVKLSIDLYTLRSRLVPRHFVHSWMLKATIDNFACLVDLTLLILIPIWWYRKSTKLQGLVEHRLDNTYLHVCLSRGLYRSPKRTSEEDNAPIKVVDDIESDALLRVQELKDRLLGRVVFKSWESSTGPSRMFSRLFDASRVESQFMKGISYYRKDS